MEEKRKENNMKWDVISSENPKKEESYTTLFKHSDANDGQAGGGFLVNKKWKNNITRVTSAIPEKPGMKEGRNLFILHQ